MPKILPAILLAMSLLWAAFIVAETGRYMSDGRYITDTRTGISCTREFSHCFDSKGNYIAPKP